MVKPKVAIITRARNRLEYTIRCINAVQKYAGYSNYEHIIISQDSTDGTVQWLDWITNNLPSKWFSNVRPIHPKKNLGDFGGIIHGTKKTDAPLIMQLDNDIEITHPNWLSVLIQLFQEEKNYVAMMLKREGIRTELTGKEHRVGIVDSKKYKMVRIGIVVACFITRRESILKFNARDNCRKLATLGQSLKITNIKATHMEGYNQDGKDSYLQITKYKRGENNANNKHSVK